MGSSGWKRGACSLRWPSLDPDDLLIVDGENSPLNSLRVAVGDPAAPRDASTAATPAVGTRVMEYLDRGVVATRKSGSTVVVTWRSLALDPAAMTFNVYRSVNGAAATKLTAAPLSGGTNYSDATASNASAAYTYFVKPVVGGVEQAASLPYTVPANATQNPYYSIPIRPMPAYHIKHLTVADLNGDGRFDFIVGRLPNTVVNEVATEPTLVEAYLHDGTFLWSVNLGTGSYDLDNIEPGPTAIDVGNWDGIAAADFDLDGRAEVMLRTAHGVTFGDGRMLSYPDNTDVQFLSALDGMTGAERARIRIPDDYLADGPVGGMFAIGWLDGVHPSLIAKFKNRVGSGSFNEMIVAFDFDGALHQRWKWNRPGEGGFGDGHNIHIVDVDQDGRDEVCEIGFVLNSDGTVRYSLAAQGIGHGDRFAFGDFDPARPGLEAYGIQQNQADFLLEYLYDASTGEILYAVYGTTLEDVGRGDVGDIDPNSPGMEFWSFHGLHTTYGGTVTTIADTQPWPHVQIQWDGDLLSERVSTDHAVIDQWVPATLTTGRVATLYNMAPQATTSGGSPIYFGDIVGDWREEVLYETNTRDGLVIFTTNTTTTNRIYTLAENPLYRNDMTTKGYLQSRHTDYFLGEGMATPPTPNIRVLTFGADAPPTIATPAAAAATTIPGTSTAVSVLGADDGGEANLTYTWAWAGPATVTFTANGTNAAKNATATFSAAGDYQLLVTVRDAAGKTVTSQVDVTVTRTAGIAVAPGSVTLQAGGTVQFSATVVDQFGFAMPPQPTFLWAVSAGGGSINSGGFYRAPSTGGSFAVRAIANGMTGTATVTVPYPVVEITVPNGSTQTDATTRTGGIQLSKKGAGSLVLNRANTYVGGTVVDGGEVIVRSATALGTGSLAVRAGSRVTLDVGAGEVSVAAIASDGLIDLGDGRLRFGGGATEDTIVAQIIAGLGDGTWNGTSGFTSAAARSAVVAGVSRGLGWLSSDDGSTTVAFAAPGDTNLDGLIDIIDVANILAGGMYDSGLGGSWSAGEFNYDGVVDILDMAAFLGTELYDTGSYKKGDSALFVNVVAR